MDVVLVSCSCRLGGAAYSFSISLPTPCTNNLAEYEAVRKGMELLLEDGAEAVEIFGDSKLVISQLTEEYRCESESLFSFMGTVSRADGPI
jgi:ribonuclease HI